LFVHNLIKYILYDKLKEVLCKWIYYMIQLLTSNIDGVVKSLIYFALVICQTFYENINIDLKNILRQKLF